MLAVRAPAADVAALMGDELDIAGVNAPALTVVSGPSEAISRFEAVVGESGIASRKLHTSHAFHSAMMDPAIAPLARRIATVRLAAPVMPYVSTATGRWITAEEATSPDYWAKHCRVPVRFSDAVAELLDAGIDTLVEVGPGAVLSTFALQSGAERGRALVLATLPGADRESGECDVVLRALGHVDDRHELELGRRRNGGMQAGLAADVPLRTRAPLDRAGGRRARGPAARPCSAGNGRYRRRGAGTCSRRAAGRVACDPGPQRASRITRGFLGESLGDADPHATFLELGFDSLALAGSRSRFRRASA